MSSPRIINSSSRNPQGRKNSSEKPDKPSSFSCLLEFAPFVKFPCNKIQVPAFIRVDFKEEAEGGNHDQWQS